MFLNLYHYDGFKKWQYNSMIESIRGCRIFSSVRQLFEFAGGRGGGKFYNVILSLNFAEGGGGVWTPIDPLLDLRMIE